MDSERRAMELNLPKGKANDLLSPQMQQQLRRLTRGLEECFHPVFNHLGSLDTIFLALGTARQSADCLLRDDPFEAWKQLMREDEWEDPDDASTTEKRKAHPKTTPKVRRIITRPMRQQLVKAVSRLDEYRRCLVALLNDLDKLQSFNAALEVAEDLQSDLPLEAAEDRTRREQAEAEEDFELLEQLGQM